MLQRRFDFSATKRHQGRRDSISMWTGIPRFEKYVPSEIDLAPSFPTPGPIDYSVPDADRPRVEGGYAVVSVFELFSRKQSISGKDERWRVVIRGGDDLGYEKDVPTMDEALALYNSVDWVYGCPDGWGYA